MHEKTLSNDEFVAFIGQGHMISRRESSKKKKISKNWEDWTLLLEGAQENIKVKGITVQPCLPINCLISV